jgi:hypothetical protein
MELKHCSSDVMSTPIGNSGRVADSGATTRSNGWTLLRQTESGEERREARIATERLEEGVTQLDG